MSLSADFRSRGVVRGGTLILDPATAVAMIERARERGVAILGVDGFWITDTTTQPDLERTINLGMGGGWDEAIEFVREREDRGLVFEVVTDEDLADL